METRNKPTTTDLIRVLQRMQDLVGTAKGHHYNDRDNSSFEKCAKLLQQAETLAIETLGFFPPKPRRGNNGWDFDFPPNLNRQDPFEP